MNFYEFMNRNELEEIKKIRRFSRRMNKMKMDENYKYPNGTIPEEYILDTNEAIAEI